MNKQSSIGSYLVILAGGFGTRLQPVSNEVPKALMPVGVDKVYLDLLLEKVFNFSIRKVYLSLHYKAELFQEYVKNSKYNKKLVCIIEPEPLGTGGAINYAIEAENISSPFFVINGDSLSDIDLDQMFEQFINHNFKVILGSSEVLDCSRYGRIIEKNGQILSFDEKGISGKGVINNGYYIFKKEVFDNFSGGFSLENDLFPSLIEKKELGIFRVPNDNFIDMGTPDDYEKLCSLYKGPK